MTMKKKTLTRYDAQIRTSLAMLFFGTAITIAGFVAKPFGIVSESVLDVFARCLIYAGSMLSVGAYVNARFGEFADQLNKHKSQGKEEEV